MHTLIIAVALLGQNQDLVWTESYLKARQSMLDSMATTLTSKYEREQQAEIKAIRVEISLHERTMRSRSRKNKRELSEANKALRQLNKRLATIEKDANKTEQRLKARVEAEIAAKAADPNFGPNIDFVSPKVGQAGHIPPIRILQVIDGTNMLVTMQALNFPSITVWITGLNTSDYVDDANIRLSHVFAITGTRQYESRGGSRKILVFEPVDTDVLRHLIGPSNNESIEPPQTNRKPLRIILAPGVSLKMVLVPPSPDGKIESFYLAETELTQAQWAAITGTNPSLIQDDQHPVVDITQLDCRQLISKLNSKGDHFYLPSAAEWLHALRASRTYAELKAELESSSWTAGNSDGHHHAAASLKPNPNGLYDMWGNCWEWIAEPGQSIGASYHDPVPAGDQQISSVNQLSPIYKSTNLSVRLAMRVE